MFVDMDAFKLCVSEDTRQICAVADAMLQQHASLFAVNVWHRVHVSLVLLVLSAVYCWAVVGKTRPGLHRLVVAIPALAAMHAVPLLFHHRLEPLVTISATFFAVRLTSGKVYAFILGRGVLMLPMPLPQFCAVMLAPFMPAELVASRLILQPRQQQYSKQSCEVTADNAEVANAMQQDSSDNTNLPFKPLPAIGAAVWQRVTPKQRYSIDSYSSNTASCQASKRASVCTIIHARQQHSSSEEDLQHSHSRSSSTDSAHSYGSSCTNGCELTAPRTLRAAYMHTGANVLLNALVVLAFGLYSCSSKQRMVSVTVHLTSMWVMWRAMEFLMQLASTPAKTWLGMTLAPHFRNPFASTSLTDFWARRWNITQGLVLRFYVYEPIVQGRLVAAETVVDMSCKLHKVEQQQPMAEDTAIAKQFKQQGQDTCQAPKQQVSGPHVWATPAAGGAQRSATRQPGDIIACDGCSNGQRVRATPKSSQEAVLAGPSARIAPRWRRQLAAAATFVVSGIEHELFLWYCTRTVGWKWFVFFSLQGMLLALEGKLKGAVSKLGLSLHPVVASLGVLLVLGLTADTLFWPVLVQPALVEPLAATAPPQLVALVRSLADAVSGRTAAPVAA